MKGLDEQDWMSKTYFSLTAQDPFISPPSCSFIHS